MALKKTALITGASNGIGLELARIFAREGYDLVLVARDKERLMSLAEELSDKSGVAVECVSLDLARTDAAQVLCNFTQQKSINIDVLVNNAGFGNFGPFVETDWGKEQQMMELNMVTLTHLTKLFVRDMVARKSGHILNIASIAAFQPGPLMAVYYATKAYVLSFSEALANELEGTGVRVTVLCPGPTSSGFQKAAFQEESALVKGKKLPTSQEVAEFGYTAMQRGQLIAIHGLRNRFFIQLMRLLPRSVIVKAVRRIQEE